MPRAAWFVAVTGGLAALIALIAGLVASWQGVDINLWLTVATALVVGLFASFLWIGRGEDDDEPAVEGFDVVSHKESSVTVEDRAPDEGKDAPAEPVHPSADDRKD